MAVAVSGFTSKFLQTRAI